MTTLRVVLAGSSTIWFNVRLNVWPSLVKVISYEVNEFVETLSLAGCAK